VFVDFDIPGIIGHGKCTGRETRARWTQSGDLWQLRRHRGELELDLVAQNFGGATATAYRKQNVRKRESGRLEPFLPTPEAWQGSLAAMKQRNCGSKLGSGTTSWAREGCCARVGCGRRGTVLGLYKGLGVESTPNPEERGGSGSFHRARVRAGHDARWESTPTCGPSASAEEGAGLWWQWNRERGGGDALCTLGFSLGPVGLGLQSGEGGVWRLCVGSALLGRRESEGGDGPSWA
jgi:hypothetical protein